MEFHSPDHHHHCSLTRDHDHNLLWSPGSTAYACPTDRDRLHMDRLRCKQDMQKLYEGTSESSYDLSLKDIVDPSYSISGNLKAIINEAELRSQSQNVGETGSRKGFLMPKLSFCFSFPGLRRKTRRNSYSSSHPNPYDRTASPLNDVKDDQASASEQSLGSSLSTTNSAYRGSSEARALSMARIHPSSQCSTCSSYTIFFKCRCLVCGRLYCSICAKENMDSLSNGWQCKVACNSGAFRKRLSRRIASRCWAL